VVRKKKTTKDSLSKEKGAWLEKNVGNERPKRDIRRRNIESLTAKIEQR